MAITYPRELPSLPRFARSKFTLPDTSELAPLRGGGVISKDLGPPLWHADYATSQLLSAAEIGIWKAWYATLRSRQSFYGYDATRQYPLAYKKGWDDLTVEGDPFSGICAIDDVPNSGSIALSDLPAGFVFTVGDYLAFDYGERPTRALHMVTEAAVADGFGDVTLGVEPFVRPGWEAGAAVYLYRAAAEMLIVPGSFDPDPVSTVHHAVTFQAIQRL